MERLRLVLQDLEQIIDYPMDRNPEVAPVIAQRIRDSVTRLTKYPQSGRAGRVRGTRELALDGLPYIIPYRVVDGHQLQILRVLHTARKWST